jgi:hypothetical protein
MPTEILRKIIAFSFPNGTSCARIKDHRGKLIGLIWPDTDAWIGGLLLVSKQISFIAHEVIYSPRHVIEVVRPRGTYNHAISEIIMQIGPADGTWSYVTLDSQVRKALEPKVPQSDRWKPCDDYDCWKSIHAPRLTQR